MFFDTPADELAAENVDDEGGKDHAPPSADKGKVSDPAAVGLIGHELTLNQVGRTVSRLVRHSSLPPFGPAYTKVFHQPGHRTRQDRFRARQSSRFFGRIF